MKYNFKTIEKKWQRKWEEKKIFHVKWNPKKKKFYCLEMYPYPSGAGLHMGHALNYTIGDICARFMRMRGFNVLYPMGYDSFGLPAENAAIKAGEPPKKYTENAIKNFMKQQKALGLSYDWERMLFSHDPNYYKWNQFFFLKLLEKGLVYRKKAPVNWCPKCDTVLANEQVHNGKCWRHEETDVETKNLEQWFIKTTAYADELLDKVDDLEWPNRIKVMQKNWIGRKEWIDISYSIEGFDEEIIVSTTRPDTNFGATFVVIAPEHPLLAKDKNLISEEYRKEIDKYIQISKKKTDEERIIEGKKKTGVFTGLYCINNLTNKKMPVWVTDFVLTSVGTGAVVGVPGHDIRDFEFAKQFNLPIIRVVVGRDGDTSPIERKEQVQEEEGTMINSGFLNGMNIHKATGKIMDYLEEKGWGKRTMRYRLKDWLVSRQRYWGTPIPVVHCEKCGIVPVPEKNLPVLLPERVKFGKGNPLETNEKFVNVKCPKCGGKARRETDTMDTFFDSSWYYLRFCDNKNKKMPFDKKKVEYWMPVNQYIGGAEHACMHLIYARFFTKALRDLGFVKIDEPFVRLFNQGMLRASDGRKMSKSLGNVINPITIIDKEGTDALRLTLMSFASPDSDTDWDEKVLLGSGKFLGKVYDKFEEVGNVKVDALLESKLNKAIKEITEDISNFKYNLAIIKIRELFGSFNGKVSKKVFETFLKLLHPFCPHITEELWEKLGNKNFISLEKWPVADEKKINEKLEEQERAVEKLIEDINKVKNLVKEKVSKVFVYVLPNEKEIYENNLIERKTGLKVNVFAVNDKDKYDPENKSKKVKPGRPGIYLE